MRKGDIRINSDFSPELLFDFAELDGVWCIIGDEVEKACKWRKGQLMSGTQTEVTYTFDTHICTLLQAI